MANELANKLKERAGAPARAEKPETTIAAYLQKMGPEIARALPKHMDPDRLARIALTTIRTNPKLLECSLPSLLGSVMQAAQLGLEPGLLGHCYIIPYRDNKNNRTEAQFQIGYRGMIDLARRSGNIESIQAHEVYQNDYFVLSYGLEDRLEHIPWHLREDENVDKPGDLRGAYMVAKFKDGGHYLHYMSRQEIDDHRKRSRSSSSGPWVTDYIEMAKKTVVRSAWKWLPISIEIMRQAEAADETVKREISDNMADIPSVIDIQVNEEPAEENTEPAAGSAENIQETLQQEFPGAKVVAEDA